MGSSNRGVTNVKLTLRVNHPATDKMKLSFAFMTGLASAQYAQPMYQQQPAMGGMGNNMLLPLLLMDGGLGGSGSSNDMLLPLMLMGGMGGDASGMGSMLPLLLLGDGLGGSGSSSDMLLPLMLMGGMGGAGGDMGGMNGLLPLLLLGGDDVKTPADLTALCATVTDVAKNAASLLLLPPTLPLTLLVWLLLLMPVKRLLRLSMLLLLPPQALRPDQTQICYF